jgi:HEAT repeat protein
MEPEDVTNIFRDKGIQSQLVQSCVSARGDDCIWYANLLKSLQREDLDTHILSVVRKQDEKTQMGLLALLSSRAAREAIPVLQELTDPDKPDLMLAAAKAANRIGAHMPKSFYEKVFEHARGPEVKAYAIMGLYRERPSQYKKTIDDWLKSDHVPEKRAGVIAAGESKDRAYVNRLEEMLETEEDGSVIPFILKALHRLGSPNMNALALPHLSHALESVRLAALEVFEIQDDQSLRSTINLLSDASERVHDLAQHKLRASTYQNPQRLVESLTIPRRRVREGIFELLESLNIKDVEIFRFARSQLEEAYGYLTSIDGLRRMAEDPKQELLIDHLNQKKTVRLDNVLRVLATQDRSGQMRIIWRGISSADSRQRSNSLEALENVMDPSLSRIMMPLLEGVPLSQCLTVGRKHFPLPHFDSNPATLCSHLLSRRDWVTVVLTLSLCAKTGLEGIDHELLATLVRSENRYVRQMTHSLEDAPPEDTDEKESSMKTEISIPEKILHLKGIQIFEGLSAMETEISIPEKILHLKGIQIFEGLSVGELAAVASVTEEVVYPPGEMVIREGESGDTMYLIIGGEVSVIKGPAGEEGGHEIELDRIGEGDYFGEMALFEDVVRSASIRTSAQSRLLVLHKQEFTEIVREYPQIALHICRVLSQRIRKLHEKIQSRDRAT